MWVKAIILIPRKDGYFLLDQATVFKRYGAFVGFKHEKAKAKRPGNGVGVAFILGAPSQIDGDLGEFTVFLNDDHIENLLEALKKSDELTAKLTGKREWGGSRPYTSTLLYHHM